MLAGLHIRPGPGETQRFRRPLHIPDDKRPGQLSRLTEVNDAVASPILSALVELARPRLPRPSCLAVGPMSAIEIQRHPDLACGRVLARVAPDCILWRFNPRKLLILNWRREWDSDSGASFRFCKLQIPHCQGCRRCQRCRRALPAIARTDDVRHWHSSHSG
jgi:hypothetical protein